MLYPAPPSRRNLTLAFTLSVSIAACTGAVNTKKGSQGGGDSPGGGNNDGDVSGPGGGGNGDSVNPAGMSAGPRLLRRLTRAEYDNTIRDLFKDTSKPAQNFPADVADDTGFYNPATVGGVETSRFQEAAEAVATKAVSQLGSLSNCDVAAKGEQTCAEAFITDFGARAFRAPLSEGQASALLALYKQVRGEPLNYDHSNGLRVVISAMLQSPRFLYHWEGAQSASGGDKLVQLGNYEMASRLSYFLWHTMPDDDLFTAAKAGKLQTSTQIEAQARRMLKDPRAKDAVFEFHSQWLHLDALASLGKDPMVYPTWSPALAKDMEAESRAFVEKAVLEDGKLETLLLGRKTVVSPQLAAHYGLEAGSGQAPKEVTLPENRAGLLTLAGFLATAASTYETSPVKRGALVRERLLCQRIPPPPPDADITPPNAAALGVSTREAYRVHSENPQCRSCHEMMDYLGFAFEGFDGIGRTRTMDAGKPVDSSGTLDGLEGKAANFKDARELMQLLVQTEETQRCMVTQWFRFASGRTEVAADKGSLDAAFAAFKANDWDLREAMVALATGTSFRYRAAFAAE